MDPQVKADKLGEKIKALRLELADLDSIYNAYLTSHRPSEAKTLKAYMSSRIKTFQSYKKQYQSLLEDIRRNNYLKELQK